jgi:hypothetical protein
MKAFHGSWIVIVCAISVTAHADPILGVQPQITTVQEGDPFSLGVSIASVADLYAFQFDLSFDPSILSAVEVTEGPFLPFGGSTFFLPGTIDDGTGTITFNADSLIGPVPGVDGNGILAVIEFAALAPGTSSISLSNVQFFDSNLNPINVTTLDGAVSVQAVPEPSAFLLVLVALGLTTLAAAKKRRSENQAGGLIAAFKRLR